MSKEPPNPMEELIRWCEANRPDVVEQMRTIEKRSRSNDPNADAMMFLISLAFNAGRTYQRAPGNADAYLPINKDPYS